MQPTYTRQDYLSDLEGFFAELQVSAPVVVLGNSLGGINALQFAARHPDLVRAMILEDIAVEVNADIGFVRAWAGDFPTRQALAQHVGSRMLPYLEDSFRHTSTGRTTGSTAFDCRFLLAILGVAPLDLLPIVLHTNR